MQLNSKQFLRSHILAIFNFTAKMPAKYKCYTVCRIEPSVLSVFMELKGLLLMKIRCWLFGC